MKKPAKSKKWIPLADPTSIDDGHVLILTDENYAIMVLVSSTLFNLWKQGEIDRITPINLPSQYEVTMNVFKYYKVLI